MPLPGAEVVLSFDPLALERCFLVSDILYQDYGEPSCEYALLGLATEDDPFRVIATPLLPGQRVTARTVHQSGYDVLRMRREIRALSARMGRRLVPIAFVHRHPGSCEASRVDLEFLTGVFIDQVWTAISWKETVEIDADRPRCDCTRARELWPEAACLRGPVRSLQVEYALCFSLIVNRARDHRLYAARRETAPLCRCRVVRQVPARLAADRWPPLPERVRQALRGRLAEEIAAKVVFDLPAEGVEVPR